MLPVPSSIVDSASAACPKKTWEGWAKLGAVMAGLAILWLGVWPAITRQPDIAHYIRHNHELGIDPAAKFYTELEATAAGRANVQSAQRRHPGAWWNLHGQGGKSPSGRLDQNARPGQESSDP